MTPPTDLPPTTLLLQEVQSVTSAMRRNQRWASSSTSYNSYATLPPSLRNKNNGLAGAGNRRGRASLDVGDSVDLMDGFVELRRLLSGVKGKNILSRRDCVLTIM